jgi:hypothetical protein|tara:strand:- start:271 stop:759 length:489 start_codon:yes stop_codon:yes gene_type:complete
MITNYLSPIGFKVVVERLPNVEFFTQRINIPGLSMSAPAQVSPIHAIYQTPDRIEYADLDLTFIADENMANYEEILRWMEGMGTPEDTKQRFDLERSKFGSKSDISILIENSARNSNIRFNFTECFPTAMAGVALDVTATDIQYPEINVTFRYTNMTFEKIS